MYSLTVLQDLQLPDGRNFAVGHDCHALSVFEVSELLVDYPDYFAPADELTADFAKEPEKLAHYHAATKRAKEG